MAKETISQTEGLCKEVANCIRNAYDRGYKQGGKDAEKEARKKEYWEQGYNEGLKDAWTCCRDMEEILFDVDNDKFSEIFDAPDFHSVLTHFDAKKCMQKIKEYEEKQKAEDIDSEIKTGDEVIYDNNKGIACSEPFPVGIDEELFVDVWFGGCMIRTTLKHVKKTGKHFDQIAEVLEQLKGE